MLGETAPAGVEKETRESELVLTWQTTIDVWAPSYLRQKLKAAGTAVPQHAGPHPPRTIHDDDRRERRARVAGTATPPRGRSRGFPGEWARKRERNKRTRATTDGGNNERTGPATPPTEHEHGAPHRGLRPNR